MLIFDRSIVQLFVLHNSKVLVIDRLCVELEDGNRTHSSHDFDSKRLDRKQPEFKSLTRKATNKIKQKLKLNEGEECLAIRYWCRPVVGPPWCLEDRSGSIG